MSYRTSVSFRGDPAPVLDAARLILVGQGFAVSEPGAGRLVARGPWMMNSHQPALQGVSSFEIEMTGSTMTITAGRRNVIVMMLFILLLAPALVVVIGITKGNLSEMWPAVAPWIVLGPAMALWFWFRTKRALDRLVENLRQIGVTPR